jgi:hypothetical protein
MAKNIIMSYGPIIALSVTKPVTNVNTPVPISGQPCVAVDVPGIAETTVDAVTGLTPLNTNCIADVEVVGTDSNGNSAVAEGDLLYISTAGVVSKDNTGKKFGKAFGAQQGVNTLTVTRTGTLVSSGATTTIQVWVGNITG